MTEDTSDLQKALTERSVRSPRIVLDAFCPAALPIPPLTIRSWLALERMESPFALGGECSAEDALHALAAVVAPRQAIAAWQEGNLTAQAPALIGAIENAIPSLHTRLREAFAPVPRDVPEDHDFRPPGCGWVLAIIEHLMAAYSMPLDAALDTPLAVAFCLRAAEAERNGHPLPGTSFTERELLSALAVRPPPKDSKQDQQ